MLFDAHGGGVVQHHCLANTTNHEEDRALARTLWPAHNFDCSILDSKYAQKPRSTHVFDLTLLFDACV
jgi:hypothetical protein